MIVQMMPMSGSSCSLAHDDDVRMLAGISSKLFTPDWFHPA